MEARINSIFVGNYNLLNMTSFSFKYIVLGLTLLLFQSNVFGRKAPITVPQQCLNIHNKWLKETFTLTQNSVGFSAPISARAYAYFSIAMYESTVEIMPSLQSLSGQLNQYKRTQYSSPDVAYIWPLVVNATDHEMIKHLYKIMPPANEQHVKHILDSITKSVSKKHSKLAIERSINYGKAIALELIEWAKTDGGNESYFANYPTNYAPPTCKSCWALTAPGYQTALLPYWGKNRLLLENSATATEACNVIPFSTDTNSVLYKDAMAIVSISKSKNPEYERIAEYWDDAPGYSGTPSGHFFSLTRQLVEQQHSTLEKAMEVYVKLGVALNDALINCWRLKYTFNFIRPITYIHRYIDPYYNSFIASPSFPEFPSGHSFQSGAGTEILKALFTDTIEFTDATNHKKTDIDGTPQHYTSFSEMAEEISISRFYGGIHFHQTLEISLGYGQKIGQFVSSELKCKKP